MRAPKARASLERPKKAGFGDYSTNAAMLLAPALGAPPREIAERLGAKLTERLGDAVDHVEVAGPGFLNVFLADAWYAARGAADRRGRRRLGPGRAGAPGAGDRRVRLGQPDRAADRRVRPPRGLRGRARPPARAQRPRRHPRVLLQQRRLAGDQARRVRARPRAPRAGPRGRLPGRLRGRRSRHSIPGAAEQDAEELGALASGADHGEHPRDAGCVSRRVRLLLPRGIAATKAIHLPSTIALERSWPSRATPTSPRARCGCARARYGDDKDRVLQRSTGAPTYFAADVAYHENKVQRGYDRLIDVLGADHHGYIGRMKGVMEALGHEPATGWRSRSCSSCTWSRAARRRRCPSAAATSSRSTS